MLLCAYVPLPEMETMKKDASEAFYVKSNSRLGCQIPMKFRRTGIRAGSENKASH
jgi:ferredoxin